MTLGKMLLDALQQLDDDVEEGRSVSAEHGEARAQIIVADRDRYSVTLRTLNVGSAVDPGDDTRAFLSAKAAAIARNLAYLEEPLAVWELDGGERVAQLRSSPPQRDADVLSYWEVELHAQSKPFATLTRYRWSPGIAEREQVDYPATFQLVARITDSLTAVLAE